MSKVMIKSRFSGWLEADENDALEYARSKVRAITCCESDMERLALVNNSLKGISFTLEDLGMDR